MAKAKYFTQNNEKVYPISLPKQYMMVMVKS